MDRLDLRPRTVGEVLDAAIRMWLANLRTLLGVVACIALPVYAVWGIVLALTAGHGSAVPADLFSLHLHFVREPDGSLRTVDSTHVSPGVQIGELLVPALAQLLITAACVRALADAGAGAVPSIEASVMAAVRRLPALLGLFVVRTVGLVVGLFALIVPGIWVAGAWSVSVPALVLEGADPGHAVGRSAHLVRGRWWPVVGALIVCDLAVGIVGSALEAAFGAIDGYASHPPLGAAVLVYLLAALAVALLVSPVNAAVRIMLYLDLRIRRGGDELAALADQLGVAAPAAGHRRAPGAGGGSDAPAGSSEPPYWPPPPGWTPPDPVPEN